MTYSKLGVWLAGLMLVAGLTANAAEPRIRVMQAGADQLIADLKFLVESTPDPALKKQWENLEATLDSFLPGIHRELPLRMDLLLGSKELTYIISLPKVEAKLSPKNRDGLLANLNSLGFNPKDLGGGLWELEDSATKIKYYLRESGEFAVVAPDKKYVPANLSADGEKPVADLKALGYDVGAKLENPAQGMTERRDQFGELRKELEAAIKFKRGETQEAFALRQLTVRQNFDELERFVVETALLQAGWVTDVEKKVGRGEFKLTALPETSLMASAQQLGTTPSRFHAVELHDKAVMSGRMTFPLDDLRKKNLREFYPALKPVVEQQIEEREGLTPDGKAAAKEAFGLLLGMLEAGIDLPAIDAVIDMHDVDGGKRAMIGAIHVADGTVADKIIALLPKVRDDWKVEQNVKEEQGVKVHKVLIPERRKTVFSALFPESEQAVYVGTSKDVVWCAIGDGALEELATAIAAVSKGPAAEPTKEVLSYQVRLGPWIRWIQAVEESRPKPKTPKTRTELQAEKERKEKLSIAEEALRAGDDVISGSLSRDGEVVLGNLEVQQGVLRAVGSLIAKFAKDNL